jgi:two-component system chemotaxis response regulator CheY
MQSHILFVDDSPTMRASVTFCLRNAGYLVTEAENGLDGLAKLQQMEAADQLPALIITDVNMPEMDGLAFITQVKQSPFRFVPVLVLTTEGENTMKERGRAAGASGWLLKPFQPEKLLWAIKKLVWPT